MKKQFLKKVQSFALLIVCLGSVSLLSSFDSGSGDDSGSGSSGYIFQKSTTVDCSTSVLVYNYTATTGSGSGSVSGSYGPSGASGSAGGSGSGSTTNSGLKGYMVTPQSYVECDWTTSFSSCTSTSCHQTGTPYFVPIK